MEWNVSFYRLISFKVLTHRNAFIICLSISPWSKTSYSMYKFCMFFLFCFVFFLNEMKKLVRPFKKIFH